MPASNRSGNPVGSAGPTALLPSWTTASAAAVAAAVGAAVMWHMHRSKLPGKRGRGSLALGTRKEREAEARSLVGSAPEMVPVAVVADDDDGAYSTSTSAPSPSPRPARMLTTLTRADGVVSNVGSSESSKGRPPRPTAVLIHGFGCTSLEWTDVSRSLTDRGIADVFAYERILFVEEGGEGGDYATLPERNVVNLVKELHTILVIRGVPPPYLLVGHSYGGLVAQCFAASHTDLVAGMVLIDPAHETQFRRFPADFALSFKVVPYLFAAYRRFVARTGIFRVMDFFDLFNFPPLFLLPRDSPHRRAALDLYSDGNVWGRVSDELRGCNSSFDSIMPRFRVEHLRGSLGGRTRAKMPTALVIAADRRYSPTLYPRSVTRAFLDMHREFVEETGAEVIMAEGSDHWVHVQQPDLVVDAIRCVLRRIEERGD